MTNILSLAWIEAGSSAVAEVMVHYEGGGGEEKEEEEKGRKKRGFSLLAALRHVAKVPSNIVYTPRTITMK